RRAQSNQIAPAEIDAEVLFTANIERGRARNDERERAHAGEKTFAQEVDVLRRNEMQHRNLFQTTGIDEEFKDVAPTDEGGKKQRQNSERKGDSKALDRAARFPEQNDSGDQRGYVGIKDSAECLFIGGLDHDLKRFDKRQLFTQAILNQ